MAIYIDNLRIEGCNVCVDVGEDSNVGTDGILTFYLSGNEFEKKDVKLYFPLQTEYASATPRTGDISKIKAILRAKGLTSQVTQLLQLCLPE